MIQDAGIFSYASLPSIYSQPSISTASASIDSTNHRLKIFGKKNPESSKKQNLNLSCTSDSLPCIYIMGAVLSC